MSNDEIDRLIGLLNEIVQAADAAIQSKSQHPVEAAACAICSRADVTHWAGVLSVDVGAYLTWAETVALVDEEKLPKIEMIRSWPQASGALYQLRSAAAAQYDQPQADETNTSAVAKVESKPPFPAASKIENPTKPVFPMKLAKLLGMDKRTLMRDPTIAHEQVNPPKGKLYRFDFDAIERLNPAAADELNPDTSA